MWTLQDGTNIAFVRIHKSYCQAKLAVIAVLKNIEIECLDPPNMYMKADSKEANHFCFQL